MNSTFFFRRYIPWIIVFGYVVLLYATLGYVRCLSDALRARGILGSVTLAIFFLLCGAVLAMLRRLSSFASRLLIVLLLGISVLSSFFLPFPEERLHLVEYSILGWLLGRALARSGKWPVCWGVGVLLVWLIGYGDELIQWFLPNRVFDVRDIFLNGIAGMGGLAIFAIFAQEVSGSPS
ncbi:MAG: VanZ family protein [Pseudomonadota bacterium]|nr:VanZ family protein [Pseudomonadota bacterium]